jgi:hypothetical protein
MPQQEAEVERGSSSTTGMIEIEESGENQS